MPGESLPKRTHRIGRRGTQRKENTEEKGKERERMRFIDNGLGV
jgi:hypothetical protein